MIPFIFLFFSAPLFYDFMSLLDPGPRQIGPILSLAFTALDLVNAPGEPLSNNFLFFFGFPESLPFFSQTRSVDFFGFPLIPHLGFFACPVALFSLSGPRSFIP